MRRRRRKKFRNTVLFVIIGVLAVTCLFLFVRVSDRKTARQAEMIKAAFQSEAVSRRNREQGEAIFRVMVDEIREALPGFACWGDDCMAGNKALSLPSAVEDALRRYFYDALQSDFTRFAGIKVALTGLIPANNLGFPGEGLTEVMARSGASAIVIHEDFSVPRTTDPVAVSLMDDVGHPLNFDGENHARLGRVAIAGIRGYFFPGSKAVNPRGAKLAFARELTGEPTAISAGTTVIPDAAERFTGCLPILFFREPDDLTAAQAAEGMAAIVSRHHPPSGQCMVLCATQADSDLDRALKATFGEYYMRIEGDPSALKASDYARLADTLVAYLDMQGALDGVRSAIDSAKSSLYALQN